MESAITALENAEIDVKALLQLRIGQLVNNIRRKLNKTDSECKKTHCLLISITNSSEKANAMPRAKVAKSDDGAGRK